MFSPGEVVSAQAPGVVGGEDGAVGVNSDLFLHTGFLVAVAAALTFHDHLWFPS